MASFNDSNGPTKYRTLLSVFLNKDFIFVLSNQYESIVY